VAARVFLYFKPSYHASPALQELYWLPVTARSTTDMSFS